MAESESDALPLGDTPMFRCHCRDNVDYYITLKSRCQAFFEIFFDFFRLFLFLELPIVIFIAV